MDQTKEHPKSEIMFSHKDYFMIREQFATLSGGEVEKIFFDIWSLRLTLLDVKHGVGQLKRVFFITRPYVMLRHGHYFIVCINVRDSKVEIIDNKTLPKGLKLSDKYKDCTKTLQNFINEFRKVRGTPPLDIPALSGTLGETQAAPKGLMRARGRSMSDGDVPQVGRMPTFLATGFETDQDDSVDTRFDYFKLYFGFDSAFCEVDNKLWFFWNNDLTVGIEFVSEQTLTISCIYPTVPYYFWVSFVYAKTREHLWVPPWAELESISARVLEGVPWVCWW
nr:uncharacterized protein LOC109172465 [Ipomoea batatas]